MDFDNVFDEAIYRADDVILTVMGVEAYITSGVLVGKRIFGVFDDPENIAYAGEGVRVEGTSPSFFVKSEMVGQLVRLDTLTINKENFWVDRVGPDDGGSRYIWLGRGKPPASNRRR